MAPITNSLFLLGITGCALSFAAPTKPNRDPTVRVGLDTIRLTGRDGPLAEMGSTSAASVPDPVIGGPYGSVLPLPEHKGSDGSEKTGHTGHDNAADATTVGIPGLGNAKALNTTLDLPASNLTANTVLHTVFDNLNVKVTGNGDAPASLLAMDPAMPQNFADPAVVTDVAGHFWAYATDDVAHWSAQPANHSGFNVQTADSANFVQWNYHTTDALPEAGPWTAVPPHVWAPDVIRLDDGRYVLYYAATPASDADSHCVGAAHAANASGPFTPMNAPLYCPTDEGGAIDPSGFQDPATGKTYVMFKVDGNNGQPGGVCGNDNAQPRSTPIRMQEVDSTDGVTPIGNVVQILDRDASDGPLVEAPSMAAVPDTTAQGGYVYLLFYSSHCFLTPNYNVRYATSTQGIWNGVNNMQNTTGTPRADYQKQNGSLLNSEQSGLIGPGGLDVHPDGRHVVFHAAQVASDPGSRRMHWGMIHVNGSTVTI